MTDRSTEIPRNIYSLWLQGIEQAPELVRLNFARWVSLNPGYRLEVLAQSDVELLLGDTELPFAQLPPQALSDIVRIRLLLEHGGIWTDATVLPIEPLDAWLPEMLTDSHFFAFHRPAPDRLISSWFLAASPGNPLVLAWWDEIRRFWSKPRRIVEGIPAEPLDSVSPGSAQGEECPYFWLHYLFAYVVETRPAAAALWNSCRRSPAHLPHRLGALFRNKPHPTKVEIEQAAAAAPVQKLDWRVTYPLTEFSALT